MQKGERVKYTKIAGGVVVNPNGLVAVVNQMNNSWSLPKGHVELGEKPHQTAIREVSEETGIPENRLKIIRKLGSYVRPKVSKDGRGEYPKLLRSITIFLVATDFTGILSPRDVENPRARWVEPDKVAKYLTHPKDKKFFRAKLKIIRKFIKTNRP